MANSAGFVELKLDYSAIKDSAIGDAVRSDAFAAGRHTWKMKCYPRGQKKHDADDGDYFSIFVKLSRKSNSDVRAICDVFLMGSDGKPCSTYAQRWVQVFQPKGITSWGWAQFVKRSVLDPCYVVDGKVRIMCVVIVLCDNDPVRGVSVPVPPSDIGVHLGGLLDRGEGTDVSFVVDGENFPAHRVMLAARSPVFRAELFGSMAEAKMSSITIQEIEPLTFRVLLRFIYTDELPQDGIELEGSSLSMTTRTELFQSLLAAADRYDLSRLKLVCAQKLWETVSVDNVATTLVFAEAHNCLQLKKRCLDFFVVDTNFRKAVLTEGYLLLMQRFPSVVDEIKAMIESKDNVDVIL